MIVYPHKEKLLAAIENRKAADDVEEAMWLPLSEVHTEQFGLRSIRQALYDFLQMESKNLKK